MTARRLGTVYIWLLLLGVLYGLGCTSRRAGFTVDDLVAKAGSADWVELSYAGHGLPPARFDLPDPKKGIAILKAIKLRGPLVIRDQHEVYSSDMRISVIYASTTHGYLFRLTFIGTSAVTVEYDGEEYMAHLVDERAVEMFLRERTDRKR